VSATRGPERTCRRTLRGAIMPLTSARLLVKPPLRRPAQDRRPRAGPALEVSSLRKRYSAGRRTIAAVQDVSFALAPGEAMALLGPNGAGKSTMVRILATLLRPDSGHASVCGLDVVNNPAAVRPLLGVALQDTGLPRRQTSRRLAEYHARLHGFTRRDAKRRASELLDQLGMAALSDRLISTYSGGERRRLDVALALIHRPPVLLLDEPTAGLDLASRRAIWQLLNAQLTEGATLLFSTHDLHEADQQSDRVAIIRDGKLIADSAPRELKQRFASRRLRVTFASIGDASTAARAVGCNDGSFDQSLTIPLAADDEILRALNCIARAGVEARAIAILEPTLDTVFDSITTPLEASFT
jgi:ABC-2 type transport system ATP-binding protein